MNDEQKKQLIEKLKAKGLDIAEHEVELAVNEAFDLIEVVVPELNAEAGAIVCPLLKFVKPMILKQVDKINGKEDLVIK